MHPFGWRKVTWLLTAWNVAYAVWIIVALGDRASKSCPKGDVPCVNGSNAGTGISVALILVLWFLGAVALSIGWFTTRPKHR